MKCNDEGLVVMFKQLWKELSEQPNKDDIHGKESFYIRIWQELHDNNKL